MSIDISINKPNSMAEKNPMFEISVIFSVSFVVMAKFQSIILKKQLEFYHDDF